MNHVKAPATMSFFAAWELKCDYNVVQFSAILVKLIKVCLFINIVFSCEVFLQWLTLPLCRLQPGVTSQQIQPPGLNLTCLPNAWSYIWLTHDSTNHAPTSLSGLANHVPRTRTHNLRRTHCRLSRVRSIEIWQLHRWDTRPEAVSLYISVFPLGTLFTVSLGLPQSKNNHSKSNHSGSMSKKKKDWKTEKGKACFGGNEAIIISMADSMNCKHARRLTATRSVLSVFLSHCSASGGLFNPIILTVQMLRLCLAAVIYVSLSPHACLLAYSSGSRRWIADRYWAVF